MSKVAYVCPRCGYETQLKGNFVLHLERKRLCPPIMADVPVSAVLDELRREYDAKPFACG
jgi:hypothetical protein